MGDRGFIAYHKALFGILFRKDKRHLSIRGRLQLSLIALSATLFLCAFFLMTALNLLPSGRNDIDEHLMTELEAYEQQVHSYFGNIAGLGISMSRRLSRELSDELEHQHADMSRVSDNPGLLYVLQERVYSILQSTLISADCSGAFVILDATGTLPCPTRTFPAQACT